MKIHVIIVSIVFPTTHKRYGENTYFPEKILTGLGKFGVCPQCSSPDCGLCVHVYEPKLHAIISNYEFWNKRIKEVQEGKAILSVRYWSGKPYKSKQIEICQLDKDSGVGVQELKWVNTCTGLIIEENRIIDNIDICVNDGLSIEDFRDWFRKYNLSNSMAIVHFTSFRY